MITTILLVTLCSTDAKTCETFDAEQWLSLDNAEYTQDIADCVGMSERVHSDGYWIIGRVECYSVTEEDIS